MTRVIDDRKVFSLYEVARSIKKAIATRYTQAYWISAELNKLNFYTHSGHCYPDLVEKKDGKIIAEMRSTLWASDYQRIDKQFRDLTKEPLKDGIQILIQATISYDELYGLSLRILDIDPRFSLGVLAREKQEAIDKLNKEGVFNLNRNLPFPLLPKRLALISVETSKGLADFLKILENNHWNYRFDFQLFPALLQGDRAVDSILTQIKAIEKRIDEFDAVALIRGGGGDVGLSCYNQYPLAKAIAMFPIPFLTGIGHATNETVSEMVAYKNAITPSNLADFLIQHFHNFSVPLIEAEKVLVKQAKKIIEEERRELDQNMKQFRFASRNLIRENRMEIESKGSRLKHSSSIFLKLGNEYLNQSLRQFNIASQNLIRGNKLILDNNSRQVKNSSATVLKQCNDQLEQSSRQVEALSPDNVLRRGFSISYLNGKALVDASSLELGQEIQTRLAHGEINSIVKAIKETNNE